MSFVFNPAQEVETRVFVRVPTGKPDEYHEVVFFATFQRELLSDLLKKNYIADYPPHLQEEPGEKDVIMFADLAKANIRGWREVLTANGKQMKFTKANVTKMFNDPVVASALATAFGKIVRGVNLTELLVKNSETPEPTG